MLAPLGFSQPHQGGTGLAWRLSGTGTTGFQGSLRVVL